MPLGNALDLSCRHSVQPAFLHDLYERLLTALLLRHEERNVASLPYLGDRKIHCSKPCFIHDNVQYFSVLNIDGKAKGITIKNAQYPLENAEITWDYQYGISNQVLPGKTAEVITQEGCLLLVKVYRE